MEGLDVPRVLFDFVVILVAAKLAGEAAERLRQPAVLGELLAGLALGPTLLGIVPNVFDATAADPSIEAVVLFVAELGAIVLLFEVGLESNLADLLKVGRAATLVALVGIVASVLLGFGASVAFAKLGYWPDRPLFHLFVGATFAATSVGITARVLKDLGRLASAEARIILGAAVLDDVGGLLVLALVTGLAAAAEAGTALDAFALAKTAVIAVGFLVVSFVLGARVVPPLFARVARGRARGVLMAGSLAFALAMSWLASAAALATIVGAFAAGILLSQAKEHHEIFRGVKPLGDVLIPFFFVVLGAALNLRDVGADAGRVLVVAGALIVVAILAKLACGLAVRASEASRLIVGVGMVPRGEVGLIFVVFGIRHLALPQWQAVALILVVMLTTLVTPPALRALFRNRPPGDVEREPGEARDEVGKRAPE